MAASIESIFNKSRFVFVPQLLFLILYAPFGLCLFIIRAFISLQLCLASLILPPGTFLRRFVLRVLYTVMGIIVREKDIKRKEENCGIIVTNHITPFDHIAVSLVYPCISVSVYNLAGPLSSILCYKDFGMSRGRDILKNNIRSYINTPGSLPIVLHPEGATTNGMVALMKYGSWAFDIDESVMVIGLHINRVPFLPLLPSVLGGSWTSDLFFMLFYPFTIYNVKYIGKFSKEDSEIVEDFGLRAQKATADALNLQISNHTVADKLEYIKRLKRDQMTPTVSPTIGSDIRSMALQVREVLPQVPLDMIEQDLLRTRNIDTTTDNFLPDEGTVPEPLPIAVQAREGSYSGVRHSTGHSSTVSSMASQAPATSTSCSNQNFNMAAQRFGISAPERTESLQERKRHFIERARRKYMEKHGLTESHGASC